ncbi:MAG: hypothetical protein AAB214_21450 [Fibrobacterota bacterium]
MPQILTNQLDEQVHNLRNGLAGNTSRSATPLPAWETPPMPDWSSLRLHRRFWAEGDALELCLDVAGEPASRSLVSRDGHFLFGPTGPAWARELAAEIAQEWCDESCPAAAA